MAPIAIWVELTGKPKYVAIKTVIADDKATQYARELDALFFHQLLLLIWPE